ncbi:MAG: lytic transglycosylase domain-containing protein [Actinomycetia bacterium]|nr:lytic transglycosylase domain-containing protein [Actinomycetes bacterium]
MSQPRRTRQRAAGAACSRLTVLLCASVLAVLVIPGSAGAETSDDVRARADAAAERVAVLQAEVNAATAEYTRALRGLAGAVTKEVSSDAAADAAQRTALMAEQDRVAAVRALEQSGGSLAMVDGLLSSGSPSDLAAQMKISTEVLHLLASDSEFSAAAAQQSSDFAEAQKHGTRASMVTVADVEAAYQRLEGLLAEQEDVLATLDEQARELAKAERVQAQIDAERAAAAAAASAASGGATAGGIPKSYLAIYQAAAATCSGLPWPVLAAIGQVESGHGTNTGPSSSGAMGPMQFLPSTFAAYAVDGDGDGDTDIWDPADAIYSAARYLCANGAGGGPRALHGAIYRYNHADWYVLMVMRVAAELATRFGEPVPVSEAP